jgi:hypothetical protein
MLQAPSVAQRELAAQSSSLEGAQRVPSWPHRPKLEHWWLD